MVRFYQTSWHGIAFDTFWELSPFRLPTPEFYSKFYELFFNQYQAPAQLDPRWRAGQQEVARFIRSRLPSPSPRVLSVGCGLGMIESILYRSGVESLHAVEVSAAPLRWIRGVLPKAQISVGLFPTVVQDLPKWDHILLCAIDYCFRDKDWDVFLKNVRAHLQPGGRCLLISASLNPFPGVHPLRFARGAKSLLRWALHGAGISHRGQWWGYCRSRAEYRKAFVTAGFEIEDGFNAQGRYWIEGRAQS